MWRGTAGLPWRSTARDARQTLNTIDGLNKIERGATRFCTTSMAVLTSGETRAASITRRM
jgi:hypothetical protein